MALCYLPFFDDPLSPVTPHLFKHKFDIRTDHSLPKNNPLLYLIQNINDIKYQQAKGDLVCMTSLLLAAVLRG